MSGTRRGSSRTAPTSSTGSTGRRSCSTSCGVPIGRRRSRRASSRSGRTTGGRRAGYIAIQGDHDGRARAPQHQDQDAAMTATRVKLSVDDVPPVLHLGRVVRDDGDVPVADAALHRRSRSGSRTARRRSRRSCRRSSWASSPTGSSRREKLLAVLHLVGAALHVARLDADDVRRRSIRC